MKGHSIALAKDVGIKIAALWNSTLGFSHGPKSLFKDQTATFVFLSFEKSSRPYDVYFVAELRLQFPNNRILSVGYGVDTDTSLL